jgi:hypothetical protein
MDDTGRVKFTYTWGTGKDIWHDYIKSSERAPNPTRPVLLRRRAVRAGRRRGARGRAQPRRPARPHLARASPGPRRQRAARRALFNLQPHAERGPRPHDWAIRSNMAHVPMDCPHREKNGWIEQNWHMARVASRTPTTSAPGSKTCRDIRDTQQPDGHIPTNCPNYLVGVPPHGFWNNAPEWGIAGCSCPGISMSGTATAPLARDPR